MKTLAFPPPPRQRVNTADRLERGDLLGRLVVLSTEVPLDKLRMLVDAADYWIDGDEAYEAHCG